MNILNKIQSEALYLAGHPVTMYRLETASLEDEEVFLECLDRMPPERRAKVERFRFPKDRKLSLAAGLLLEAGFAARGLEYRTAPIEVEKNGKPFLKGSSDLFFSLSHSGDIAIASIAENPVGCDIEEIKPSRDIANLARRFFAPEEAREAAVDTDCFFRLWTLKESYLKATGEGIAVPISEVVFSGNDGKYTRGDYSLISSRYGDYYESVCVKSEYIMTEAPYKWYDNNSV